ncbi:MAG: hypothetical protein NXI14_08795 [bacterium]|nr:hypothetical protein [bacterium]
MSKAKISLQGDDRVKALFPEHERAYFDQSKASTRVEPRYVVWIDMMGAKAAMERSLPQAANFFAKIHDAVLRGAPRAGVEIVPITDGVFMLAQSQLALSNAVRLVMLRLCTAFLHERKVEHRFLVRGGIAAGRVLLGREMSAGFRVPQDAVRHAQQLPVGTPIGEAYEAEHDAPPYGLYVHQSARADHAPLDKWPHDRNGHWPWWNPRDSEDIERATLIGEAIASHFQELTNKSVGAYDATKMSRDVQRAKDYFP